MNYTLMHKDIAVIMLSLDEDTGNIIKIGDVYNYDHLPVGIHIKNGVVDSYDLKNWWNDRSIPASRDGIKKALEVLDIPNTKTLLTKCFGLSLSDHYWIKPINDEIMTWSDINFFENSFSEDIGDILLGKSVKSKNINLNSPDNTSDGFLKKRWKIVDGKRCLIKGGSNPFVQQPFNEVVASIIAEALDIPHVHYDIIWDGDKPYSICEDFVTTKTELVSAWRIMQIKKKKNNVSVYNHFMSCCDELNIIDARLRIDQMIVLDYIIANEDRHQNNFGLIRDVDTLKWIGIAPIYDSGSSLGYDKLSQNIDRDIQCKPFKNDHEKQIQLVTSFEWINFDKLKNIDKKISSFFNRVIVKNDIIDEDRVESIICFINKRIDRLYKLAQKRKNIVDNILDDVLCDVKETYINDEE